MGGFSLIHWIIFFLLLTAGVAWPIAAGRILKRIGYNPLWGLLVLFPLLSAVGACFVAFTRWPRDEHTDERGNAEFDSSDPDWPPPGPTFVRKQPTAD